MGFNTEKGWGVQVQQDWRGSPEPHNLEFHKDHLINDVIAKAMAGKRAEKEQNRTEHIKEVLRV